MKKAILVVSFGTSHHDALERNIEAIEDKIAASMPEYEFRRAFTSGMIMKKLRERDGLSIDDTSAALGRLLADGFEEVIIQPTHILNGDEYDKLVSQAEPFKAVFKRLNIGAPLLTVKDDYTETVKAIFGGIQPPEEKEALVFMGHGTEHHTNGAYAQFEYILHDLGYSRAFVGTVEGYPQLSQVMKKLSPDEIDTVRLIPLMIVAGDHAKNDMAGDEDSWKSQLEEAGYDVKCQLVGLGEFSGIQEIFLKHAMQAAEVTA